MKKFLGLFAKHKQRGDLCNVHDVSLPDNVNKDTAPKNEYKHYQFDSDCLNIAPCGPVFETNVEKSNLKNFLAASSRSHIPASPLSNLFDLDDVKNRESTVSNKCDRPVSEVSPTGQERKPELEGGQKSGKNTYVITINNSKYFHIGSQKTVYVSEKVLPGVHVQQENYVGGYQSELETNLNKLLDCEDKLSEKCITLISQHPSDRWKEFLMCLGMEDAFLKQLERRNDNNKCLILYDGLQEYISLFPNTSLGFVINMLNNTQHLELIKILALEIKH